MGGFWNVATYKWKIHNGKFKIISFLIKFIVNSTHCHFLCVGMNNSQLYLCKLSVEKHVYQTNKYVVNKKLHFDDVSFLLESEWFFFFTKYNLSCPKKDICTYISHAFFMKQRWTNSFNERLVTRDGRTGLRNHFMSN